MKTSEEKIASGCNPIDVYRVQRTQEIYDFVVSIIERDFPDSPEYLQKALVHEHLVEVTKGRICS
jgi:hypothetical protein